MNCERYERWIALSVSEDLSPRRAAWLNDHFAECSQCRALARDMAKSRTLLRQREDNLTQDAAFARVRARTLAALEDGRREPMPWYPWPTGRWALPMAALFVLVVALAVLWLRQPQLVEPPPTPDSQARLTQPRPIPPALPEPAQTSSTARPTSPVPSIPSRERVAVPTQNLRPAANTASLTEEVKPSPCMLIRLETNDPQVVIYWLVDEKPTLKREVSHG